MIFRSTEIKDTWLIDIEPHRDKRGFFTRTWCEREFVANGLETRIAQESVSWNLVRGTMRGLHLQKPPHEEVKIVRCTRGAIFDVVVDIRPRSPTFLRWLGFELSADNHRALYVPKGCLHGFQTLVDETEVFYQISNFYAPESATGYRYDDPVFSITWPLPITAIGDNDLHWPAFRVEPGSIP